MILLFLLLFVILPGVRLFFSKNYYRRKLHFVNRLRLELLLSGFQLLNVFRIFFNPSSPRSSAGSCSHGFRGIPSDFVAVLNNGVGRPRDQTRVGSRAVTKSKSLNGVPVWSVSLQFVTTSYSVGSWFARRRNNNRGFILYVSIVLYTAWRYCDWAFGAA